jgi:hypothetical protein
MVSLVKRASWLSVVWACAAGACHRSQPTPTADPSPGVEAGTPAADRCEEVVRLAKAEVAALPSSCAKDADCTCYRGGIPQATGCGGVSSVAVARKIDELTTEYLAQKPPCHGRVNCAARACNPTCSAGKCVAR